MEKVTREYKSLETIEAGGKKENLFVSQRVEFSLIEKPCVKCYFKSAKPGIFDPVDSDRDINMRLEYWAGPSEDELTLCWDTATFKPVKKQDSYNLEELIPGQEEWLRSNKAAFLQRYVRQHS